MAAPGRRGQLDGDVAARRSGPPRSSRDHRRRAGWAAGRGRVRTIPMPVATATPSPRPRRAPRGPPPCRPRRRWCRGTADLVEVDLRGGPPVQPSLDLGQRGEDGQGPLGHPVGSRASSTRPTMWAWVRTTTSSLASTTARVAAIPPRSTGSARETPAVERQSPEERRAPRRGRRRRRAGCRGPCPRRCRRSSGTRRRSVVRDGSQADSGHARIRSRRIRGSRQHPGHGTGGAEAVVDARPRSSRRRTRRAWPGGR